MAPPLKSPERCAAAQCLDQNLGYRPSSAADEPARRVVPIVDNWTHLHFSYPRTVALAAIPTPSQSRVSETTTQSDGHSSSQTDVQLSQKSPERFVLSDVRTHADDADSPRGRSRRRSLPASSRSSSVPCKRVKTSMYGGAPSWYRSRRTEEGKKAKADSNVPAGARVPENYGAAGNAKWHGSRRHGMPRLTILSRRDLPSKHASASQSRMGVDDVLGTGEVEGEASTASSPYLTLSSIHRQETAEVTQLSRQQSSPARHLSLSSLRAKLDTLWRTKLRGPSKKARGKQIQRMPSPSVEDQLRPTTELACSSSPSQHLLLQVDGSMPPPHAENGGSAAAAAAAAVVVVDRSFVYFSAPPDYRIRRAQIPRLRHFQLQKLRALLVRWHKVASQLSADLADAGARRGIRGRWLPRPMRKQFARLREPLDQLNCDVERCYERFVPHGRTSAEEKGWIADDEDEDEEDGEGGGVMDGEKRKGSKDSGYASFECGCESALGSCAFAESSKAQGREASAALLPALDGGGGSSSSAVLPDSRPDSTLMYQSVITHSGRQSKRKAYPDAPPSSGQGYGFLPPRPRFHALVSGAEVGVLVTALSTAFASLVSIHSFLEDVVAARTDVSLVGARVAEAVDVFTRQRAVLGSVLDQPRRARNAPDHRPRMQQLVASDGVRFGIPSIGHSQQRSSPPPLSPGGSCIGETATSRQPQAL